CCALPDAFGHRVVVGLAYLPPAAVAVLTALEPLAPAQYPVLRHILADRAQAAQDLPGAVDIIDAPTAVPGTVVVLRVDQILNGVAHALRFGIETNVTKQFQCARGQITAGWIENRIVMAKGHVFKRSRGRVV